MARIAGVDLPREKRVEIALTYIYGIGRKTANDILAATGVNPDTRVKDMTEEDEAKIREYIDHHLIVEGRQAPRCGAEHQASGGDRLLPRRPPQKGPACTRPAHQDQRAHP